MSAPVKACDRQEKHLVGARLDDDRVLRAIVEGTASETGRAFFDALVRNVARALDVAGCWVTEYCAETRSLRALAFWYADHYIEDYAYCIKGTPCEPVIETREYVHFPDNLVCLFPSDPDLAPLDAVSYAGVALLDTEGGILGHLAIIDTKPQPRNAFKTGIFRVFASRAGAELRRLRAESKVIARETELRATIDGAMDAIVVVDEDWGLVRMNPAARALFGRDAGELTLDALLTPAGMAVLRATACMAADGGGESQWLPGGVEGRSSDGGVFPVEGTLSSFTLGGRRHCVLILRDVGDRERARETIRRLSSQTDYLRERLESLEPGEIIGDCPPMQRLRDEIAEVGPSSATVLITGETGTGKELVAGAVHRASHRAEGPFVAVNCAAVPANLMESEFFGHEEGAFTGATKRRTGRFALADGGTLFLDEVGELSPDVQAKLLRVLQEGAFEPVGGSVTCRVDARVVAATNRDLQDEVRAGRFRQDLYYRLSVFPLHVPPLRERTDDIPLLATAFIQRISRDLARTAPLLTDSDMLRLQRYSWPGNVRELQNVLERAVITARSGVLDLARALPYDGIEVDLQPCKDDPPAVVYTSAEMADLERANLRRALDSRDWKVSGPDGAAALLGMPASTLSSRMKALGIRRS